MKYSVVDAGYKLGKEKNVMFATNSLKEAVAVAKDAGEGILVIENLLSKQNALNAGERIVFVSKYETGLSLPA